MEYQDRFAVVTGASAGIGRAFAEELARRGTGVALVARRADRLLEIAEDLTDRYGVPAQVIAADLTAPEAIATVRKRLEEADRTVDILINNAGFGSVGRFIDLDAQRLRREVDLDVGAVTSLAREFLPDMVRRGSGLVINVASTAAFQPVPYMAVYGAAKAFVLSFSEALAAECRPHGVRVLALCPGPVDTEFFDAVGAKRDSRGRSSAALGRMVRPEVVVRSALRAADQGRFMVAPGLLNTGLSVVSRLAPRRLVLAVGERVLRSAGAR